jgi:hypothetical protein
MLREIETAPPEDVPSDRVSVRPSAPPPESLTTQPHAWTDPKEAPARKIDWRPLAVAVVLGAIVLAWAAGTMQGRARTGSTGDATATAFPPPPVVLVVPGSSGEPTTPAIASVEPTTSTKTPPAPSTAPRPRPRGTCNPPYTIEQGIRVPKKECL